MLFGKNLIKHNVVSRRGLLGAALLILRVPVVRGFWSTSALEKRKKLGNYPVDSQTSKAATTCFRRRIVYSPKEKRAGCQSRTSGGLRPPLFCVKFFV